MAQKPYHNPGRGYMGTLSQEPTPYTRKTTDEHKGSKAGKDIRPRTTAVALSDVKVIRADGTTYWIESTRSRYTAKRKTRKVVQAQRTVSEAIEYGLKQHERLSIDEIRARNGL